jgi:hypothetical protein
MYFVNFYFINTKYSMSSSSSAQAMVRPGEAIDLYYYDHETSKKQVWPTSVNTKYVQQFNNLSGGSSVFTIPPQQGIQDVVCTFVLPQLSAGDANGLALNRGWGYQLINRVSFRYGGSSQYFLSGQQMLQNAVRRQPSREAASDILTLGGQAAGLLASGGTNTLTTGAQYASVVLTLPHATPSGVGKAHPFPSDLLTQQIQVTVELNPPSSLYSSLVGATGTAPTSLSAANFQVQQVIFNNAGDALARRVDMAENAYAFPCEFVQQQQTIALANTVDPQSVVLTGFRSGEVKSIQIWLQNTADLTGPVVNPWNWYLPVTVEMTYAGDIYARFDSQSSTLWNMVNGDKYPGFSSVALADAGANFSSQSQVSTYVELPFAQSFVDEDSHHVLVHGKPITNGIVNLLLQTPSAASTWVLNVSYVYNSTLLMSQGTADYVF